ncbi:hypothetical protein HIM_07489 [Hirsutella minnesotensis 3608]|uniref:Uncharacterized protein n=1 Tax=Hirsutella minnesotensis 3608 TaxID=1043627 RepID=A0A0F7ZN44_9HYPO|nr:hypothetical protein HIM_07489 [Hirsutella minnesotensis 3608]
MSATDEHADAGVQPEHHPPQGTLSYEQLFWLTFVLDPELNSSINILGQNPCTWHIAFRHAHTSLKDLLAGDQAMRTKEAASRIIETAQNQWTEDYEAVHFHIRALQPGSEPPAWLWPRTCRLFGFEANTTLESVRLQVSDGKAQALLKAYGMLLGVHGSPMPIAHVHGDSRMQTSTCLYGLIIGFMKTRLTEDLKRTMPFGLEEVVRDMLSLAVSV